MSPTLSQTPSPVLRYSVLLSAQLAIGAAAIFARYALHGGGPIIVSALRLVIAAIPMLVWSFWRHRDVKVTRRHEVVFAMAGVALGAHFSTWIASLLYTSIAVATLLVCTTPIWTALHDVFIRKRFMPPEFWYCFGAGAIGLLLIVNNRVEGAIHASTSEWLGDLLAFSGGLAFAVYLIIVRGVGQLYPTVVIVSRTYSWAALSLIGLALITHQQIPGNDQMTWFGILAMAFVSQMLGHTAINSSLRWFASSTVAFSTLLEPVFAALLAAVIFHEILSLQALVGCVVVLLALGKIMGLQRKDELENLDRDAIPL